MCSAKKKRTVFYQTVRRGSLQTMLDEVEISPVLLKVTGAGHSLLSDGSRLKKLCVGWVGSPAMLRALRVRRVL